MHPQKLSILMPVYNEIRTLEQVLHAVLEAPLPCAREIIVVDDGSTDGSRELLTSFAAAHPEVNVIMHSHNQGKGAAIRTAIKQITGDWAIIQDADLEYNPKEIQNLLVPVIEGSADAVFGSRFLVMHYRRVLFYWHSLANRFLTTMTNVVTDLNLSDMETGYKLVRASILKHLNLRSSGFDLEPEITVKLARWGARIYEVPISYKGRSYLEGKKIRGRDAFHAMVALLRYGMVGHDYSDNDGFLILQAVRKAKRFNRWTLAQFDAYLGDEVMEAGCGIGNLTDFLLEKRRLVCLDYEDFYVDRVRQAYGHLKNIHVHRANLTVRDDLTNAIEGAPVDSVLCSNVLEHIEDDVTALKNFHEVLKPGGHALILVPHNPALYSGLDKVLGHFRRYTPEELTRKMTEAGFQVISCAGFNRVGGLGWRISAKILGRDTLSPGQMTLFELGMPVIRLLEKIPFHTHNSLVAIGRKVDGKAGSDPKRG